MVRLLRSLALLLCAIQCVHSYNYPLPRESVLRLALVKVTNADNGQMIEIEAGAPLSLAAARSGMKLSFQCKQGTCKSCTTLLDGVKVDTCMTKVPNKASIQIKKKRAL